ncbi:MAG: hypothetical protein FJ029_15080, partial [Actinobacteria bacterium]|nr:hypothetical protein [Actinomycetota bacterium]
MPSYSISAGREGQRKANRAAQEADWLRRLREDIQRVRYGGPNRPPTGNAPAGGGYMPPDVVNHAGVNPNSAQMSRFRALDAGTGWQGQNNSLSNADLQRWLTGQSIDGSGRPSGGGQMADRYAAWRAAGGDMDKYQNMSLGDRQYEAALSRIGNWTPQRVEQYLQQDSPHYLPMFQAMKAGNSYSRPDAYDSQGRVTLSGQTWSPQQMQGMIQKDPQLRAMYEQWSGGQQGPGAPPPGAPPPGAPPPGAPPPGAPPPGAPPPGGDWRTVGTSNPYNGPGGPDGTGWTRINADPNDPRRDWADHGSSQQLREAQMAYSGIEARKRLIRRQIEGPGFRGGAIPWRITPEAAAWAQQYSLEDIYTDTPAPWMLGGPSSGMPTQATKLAIPQGAAQRFQQLYGAAPGAGQGPLPKTPEEAARYYSQKAQSGATPPAAVSSASLRAAMGGYPGGGGGAPGGGGMTQTD